MAYERLITLYEREGYLTEALDVAIRAQRFYAGDKKLAALQNRLTQIEAEHGT